MFDLEIKSRVIALRKRGLSYRQIQQRINIPKSTLSYWLKNVPLKQKDKDRLYTKQIARLNIGALSHRANRQKVVNEIITRGSKEVPQILDGNIIKLLGAAIYWGEGSKKDSVRITNSDPALILFMVRWLEGIFEVKPSELRAWLNIYHWQSQAKIIKFWSDLTGIPVANFGKPFVKPNSTGNKKNDLYHGTIQIRVAKSADLQYRIQGIVRGILERVDIDADKAGLTWQYIKVESISRNLIDQNNNPRA